MPARLRAPQPNPFLLLTVVLIGLNFRAPILAVSPMLDDIRVSTGLSSTAAGLLTTIPVICFGLVSPLAPILARRLGLERSLALVFLVVIAGTFIRSLSPVAMLFLGTIVIGAAIANGNVLMPSFIKREAPRHIGRGMALYSASVSASGSLGAGLIIPAIDRLDLGWRGGLLLMIPGSLIALAILIPWALTARRAPAPAAQSPRPNLWRHRLAWIVTIYMGMQSFAFFSLAAWLPSYLTSDGMSADRAGFMLSIFPLMGAAGAFLAPMLAHHRPDQRWLIWLSSACLAIGVVGLLVSPMTGTILWVLAFGFGSGMTLGLALLMIGLRSDTAPTAAELSGMSQGVGYTIAAVGPFLLGLAHDLTASWTAPLLILLVALVPLTLSGLGAARDAVIIPQPHQPVG